MFNKLKSIILDDTIYIAFLLVLTAVCSFGLGKLSVMQTGNAGDNKSKVSAVQTLYNPNVGTSSLNIQPQQLLQTVHTPLQ